MWAYPGQNPPLANQYGALLPQIYGQQQYGQPQPRYPGAGGVGVSPNALRQSLQATINEKQIQSLFPNSVLSSDTVVITAVNRPYYTTSCKYRTTEKLQPYKAVLQPCACS